MAAHFDVSFKSDRTIVERKVVENLGAAADELREKMIEWIREQMIYGYSKEVYDTGWTFDHIDANVKRDSQNTYTVAGGVKDTDYAVFVHNGTRKMKARPFIRDALQGNINNIRDIVESHAKDGMD